MRFSLPVPALIALPFAPADSARAGGASSLVAEIVTFRLNAGVEDAARSLNAKIDLVQPKDRAAPASGCGGAVYPLKNAAKGFKHMPILRGAIRTQHKVQIAYKNGAAEMSIRIIRPLQLEYWGRVWTLSSWCEFRAGFRGFRVDRMQDVAVLPSQFDDDVGKTLSDYLHQLGQ